MASQYEWLQLMSYDTDVISYSQPACMCSIKMCDSHDKERLVLIV